MAGEHRDPLRFRTGYQPLGWRGQIFGYIEGRNLYHRSDMFFCLYFFVARSGALFSNCEPCNSKTRFCNDGPISGFELGSLGTFPPSFGFPSGCGSSNRNIVYFFGIAILCQRCVRWRKKRLTLQLVLLSDDLECKLGVPNHNSCQTD